MIEQKAYVHPVLGNIYEVKQTDPEPDDKKLIENFPLEYELIDNGKPITLICNTPWIAVNLAMYMREGGCNELRFATKKSGPFVVVFDDYEIEREGDVYNKNGDLVTGSEKSFAHYPKITDSSNDCEF